MKLTPYWLIAATFLGIGDTAYLVYEKLHGIIPGCLVLNGCEKVLTSEYSSVFGVTLAHIGLVYYVYFLALAILLSMDPYSKALRMGTLAYATIGLLFSIYFEWFQWSVIGALCQYCAISALVTLILFGLSVWHWRSTKTI